MRFFGWRRSATSLAISSSKPLSRWSRRSIAGLEREEGVVICFHEPGARARTDKVRVVRGGRQSKSLRIRSEAVLFENRLAGDRGMLVDSLTLCYCVCVRITPWPYGAYVYSCDVQRMGVYMCLKGKDEIAMLLLYACLQISMYFCASTLSNNGLVLCSSGAASSIVALISEIARH